MATGNLGALTPISGATQLFYNLLDFTWRSVSFPSSETEVMLRQDLVIHKFADRDGAHVESTGRHPLQFTAKIPFIVGISAGQNESWSSTPLYPDQWRAFFTACSDNSSGTLQHPELGAFTVKCESLRTIWSADRRGGVDCEATWVESDDTGGDLTASLASASPTAALVQSAAALDAQLADLGGTDFAGLAPYVPSVSLSSLVSSILAVVDVPTLLARSIGGQIAALQYQVSQIESALDTASNSLQWPLLLAASQAQAAIYDAQATLLAQQSAGPKISIYTTAKDATLGQLATIIPADITVLMSLNSQLLGSPVVPAGTAVRFIAITG